MLFRSTKGTTLIETIVVAMVFTIAIIGLISAALSSVYFIENSKNATIAIADLTNIMEKIRATPFDSITTQFPDAVADGPGNSPYSSILGGYTLSNEQITVSYTDANSDPLEILVTITWQDRRGRTYSASMSTFGTG